jgi:hypothetical protein
MAVTVAEPSGFWGVNHRMRNFQFEIRVAGLRGNHPGDSAVKKYVLAAVLAGLASGALAQTSTTTTTTTAPSSGSSYYVVQDASTKKCTVTTTKPTSSSMTAVGGDGTVYHSETEADAAMKKVTVCTH